MADAAARRVLVLGAHAIADGGTGAHLAASLRALEEAGHDVVAAVMERNGGPLPASVAHVVPGMAVPDVSEEARERVVELVRDVRPDVIHVQQLEDGSLIPLLRREAPVVYNVHNFVGCPSGWSYFRRPGHECTRPHGAGCVPNLTARGCAHALDVRDLPAKYRRAERRVTGLRNADAVVAHSNFVARHLTVNGVRKPTVVPLFSTVTPGPPDGPAGRRVLFSGRVVAAKGVGTLLRAAAEVGAQVDVCGDGWWAPKARQLAQRLGVESLVRFRGWVSREELSMAYREAAVATVPSHWPEPFGLVGLEAMVNRRPVVASATGGIPEWLEDGETGLLVPPGDAHALAKALATLLDDPARCKRMGESGAARAARLFSQERYLEAIGRAYTDAIAGWNGGR